MKIRKSEFLIFLIVIWGILLQLLPTSFSEIDTQFSFFSLFFRIAIVFLVLFIIVTKKYSKRALMIFFVNIALMIFFTIFTAHYKGFDKTYYNLYLYILLALILSLNIKQFKCTKCMEICFYGLCIIMCMMGILVVLKNSAICELLSTYYNRYWKQCTYYMTLAGKPVGTYATHSIAGFMYFQFLIMLYFKNQKKGNILNVILMCMFVFIIIMLRSNTAITLLGLAAILLLFEKRKKQKLVWFIIKVAFVIGICILLYLNMDWIQTITNSKENGVLGRFTGTSLFINNFNFLKNNIMPIGFTSSDTVWLSDCGYIIALLRGGIFNVIVIYTEFYFFLKRNITKRKAIIPLLSSLIIFEIGYPVLMELKYVVILPFIIIYINSFSTDNNTLKGEI